MGRRAYSFDQFLMSCESIYFYDPSSSTFARQRDDDERYKVYDLKQQLVHYTRQFRKSKEPSGL